MKKEKGESPRLGLIAGNGKFPVLFAHKAKKQGFQVITAGVQGDTSFMMRFVSDQYRCFHVGDLRKLFEYFKSGGVAQVIMAGQVNPDNLFDPKVKPDEEFQKILTALKDRKADTIFTALADKLKEYKMELMDSTFLLQDLLAAKGTLTRRAPTLSELADIEFGREIAKAMGGIDVGQTVVVKEKAIVAIEAMEGTDRTIVRGGEIAQQDAVVVKMSKPNQDFRFDVPVIGPRTLQHMIQSRCACLAIEAGKTLIIDKDKTLQLANKAGICIVSA